MSVSQFLREESSNLPPEEDKPDYLYLEAKNWMETFTKSVFTMSPLFHSQLKLVFPNLGPL